MGVGWIEKKLSVVRVTQKFLAWFLALPEFPNDRRLSESRRENLKRHHEQGSLRAPQWATVYVKETNTTYRANGQHTSSVFSEANGTLGKNQSVFLAEAEADNLRTAANYLSTFDSSISSRSQGDVTGFYMASIPEIAEKDRGKINAAVAALAFEKWGPWYSGLTTKEDRAELLFDNVERALWIHDMLDGKHGKRLKKVPVLAAMLRTYDEAPTQASSFWSAVREGSTTDGTTERTLNTKLIQIKIGSRAGISAGQRIGSVELYNLCIKKWNVRFRRFSLPLLGSIPSEA